MFSFRCITLSTATEAGIKVVHVLLHQQEWISVDSCASDVDDRVLFLVRDIGGNVHDSLREGSTFR